MLLVFAKLLGPPALLLIATALHDSFAQRAVFLRLGVVTAICHVAISFSADHGAPSDSSRFISWNLALIVVPWILSLCAFAILRPRSRNIAVLAFAVVYFVVLVGAPMTGIWLGLLAK